jgi:Putative peptidoglycan binding domain
VSTGGDEREERVEDWFEDGGEPGGFRDPDAETWLEEPETRPGGPRDRRPLLIGAAAAVVLILLAIGIARLVSGGDDEGGTTTQTVTTTAQETEPPTTTAETETAPAVTSTVPEDVTLQSGDSGDEVMRLQEALAALGYDVGEADGAFGPSTEEAVRQFQADSGITADGVAGPQTLQAINDALAATG